MAQCGSEERRAVPTRISVMTFNVWCSDGRPAKWPAREPAIRRLMRTHRPDIVCLQENHPDIEAAIQAAVPEYPLYPFKGEDEGWSYEGGILWKQSMFELVAHGKEPLSIHQYPRRGLFWARLRVRGTSQTILVTTMHLPWNGTEDELRTGLNPRIAISREAVAAIDRLVQANGGADEGAILCGDMNDDAQPARVFTAHGFVDAQEALMLAPIPTHPCRPSDKKEDVKPDQTLDWIFYRGNLRPVSLMVLRHLVTEDDEPLPSDHAPVVAMFELPDLDRS